MLTPDYYESCADDIINLYAQLDEVIISDIVRRIMKTGTVTETAKWQIKQAQEMGLLYDDIISEIGRRTDATDNHVRALFEDAGVRTVQYDSRIYRQAGLIPVDIRQSPAMLQVLNAGYRKTLGNMKNLTMTTAVTSQNTYINACNLAYMQITSGAFSYQEAIRQAIKSVAEKGTTVLYPSGHVDRIDVAVRRAVLTGVGQTCRKVCEINAEEMGCDLMEISAHSGARPTHAEWQGQIVSLSGRKGYLNKDDIGYGTGDGFGGYNCQHDWYPYFEGISTRNYTEKALKQMNAKCIEYNGKKYSEYEISQMQRAKERQIRALKREAVSYDTAFKECQDSTLKAIFKEDFNAVARRLKDKEQKLKDFVSATGQQRDRFREQVYNFGHSTAQKAVWANRKNLTSVNSNGKIKAGGKITDKNFTKVLVFEEQAKAFYKKCLKDSSDIEKIAHNTGFSYENIEKIKNHIMVKEHLFADGSIHKFNENIDQALAWQRLIEGSNIRDTDILLLNHELRELEYMAETNCPYETAHKYSNEKYDWQTAIDSIVDTDNLNI